MSPKHQSLRWQRLSRLAPVLALAVPLSAQQANQTPTAGDTGANSSEDEAIVLSPFQVDATRDKGYYAENTLAGSRMKTNISDLGASISVITKQQMEDTASLDINDVFRYEVNTEGSGTYTPPVLSMRNDGPADTNAGFTSGANGTPMTNATSNRVRGLGVPSAAINYYWSVPQVPMDAYNIERLEISRGPNSMLFGMGSPAGIVNQTYAQANVSRDRTSLGVRFDDRGSYRGNFSTNRVLLKDKLALYTAGVYDNRQFVRKPSYDITKRAYGAITYKPFSKTTLRAMIEGYHNDNRRPNTMTPRDFVTQWNLGGRPIYDALNKTVTFQDSGRTIGPFINNTSSPYRNDMVNAFLADPNVDPSRLNRTTGAYTLPGGGSFNIFSDSAFNNLSSPWFVPGMFWVNQSRTLMQINDGQLINWFQPLGAQTYRTTWGTATNPSANAATYPTTAQIWANRTWADVYNRYYGSVGGWTAAVNSPNVGNYKYPGVTDSSIYDWQSTNILQMNWGKDRNATYNVELEQEILPSLHFNAGFFRQDFDSTTNYTVAQLNATTLYVDINKYLPDGTPNPMVGKVYVEDQDPDRFINGEQHDHYRAMLAWSPDFTQKNGWMKWLGRHQVLGLWSRQESMTTTERLRAHWMASTTPAGYYRYLNNQNANADGTPSGWSYKTNTLRRQFYLAGPNDPSGVVTRSSGEWDTMRYLGDVRVYDYASSSFQNLSMLTDFDLRDETTGRNQRELESLSAGMTNYLWNDRLITTFGVRKDDFRARSTSNGQIKDAEGNIIAPAMTNAEKWVNGYYQKDVVFNRWQNWNEISGTTRTLGGVFRPFRNWGGIDRRAATGNQFWQFIRDFGVSYNKSDNFNPPSTAEFDVFGTALPKPTGKGTDYGFQFSMLDDKLFARVTWFEASNTNERISPGSSINRLKDNIDTTLFRNWARTIAMINMGMDPRAERFGEDLTPAEEDAVRAGASAIWKMDHEYYANIGTIGATRDAESEGVEVTVNYNPTRNWTIKFTGSKQDTFNSNVNKQFDAWYAVRAPVWEAAKASDYLLPQYQQYVTYTRENGRLVNLGNFMESFGYRTEVQHDRADGNTNVRNYYAINVEPQYALSRDLNGQRVMGQRRYRWSLLSNYVIDRGVLNGFGFGGSQRWEDKSIIGYLGRPSGSVSTNPNLMDLSDITKPVWDEANWYTDLWVSYTRKVYGGKARMKVQLNVVNVFEDGDLQVTAVNYDGSPYAYRIIDPRQFILSASLEF